MQTQLRSSTLHDINQEIIQTHRQTAGIFLDTFLKFLRDYSLSGHINFDQLS